MKLLEILDRNNQQQQQTSQQQQHQSSVNNPTDNRWISSLRQSLRRRDPEIQPTLPSINNHLHHNSHTPPISVGFSIPNEKRIRTGKISANIRKSRSVDRMRTRKVCSDWSLKNQISGFNCAFV